MKKQKLNQNTQINMDFRCRNESGKTCNGNYQPIWS